MQKDEVDQFLEGEYEDDDETKEEDNEESTDEDYEDEDITEDTDEKHEQPDDDDDSDVLYCHFLDRPCKLEQNEYPRPSPESNACRNCLTALDIEREGMREDDEEPL